MKNIRCFAFILSGFCFSTFIPWTWINWVSYFNFFCLIFYPGNSFSFFGFLNWSLLWIFFPWYFILFFSFFLSFNLVFCPRSIIFLLFWCNWSLTFVPRTVIFFKALINIFDLIFSPWTVLLFFSHFRSFFNLRFFPRNIVLFFSFFLCYNLIFFPWSFFSWVSGRFQGGSEISFSNVIFISGWACWIFH